jgi:hypothetical protein
MLNTTFSRSAEAELASILDQVLQDLTARAPLVSPPDLARALACVEADDPFGARNALQAPLEQLADAVLDLAGAHSPKVRFLYSHLSLVERQFRAVIERHEGRACCADKTSFLLRSLLRFLRTGKPVTFDRDQEYTFHLPRTVFTTHGQVVEFFEAIHDMAYGRPERYVRAVVALNEISPPA